MPPEEENTGSTGPTGGSGPTGDMGPGPTGQGWTKPPEPTGQSMNKEVICEVCGFEAKNANGLRLHSVKHKNDNKPVRVELYNKETGKLIIDYPVVGKEELDKAKKHAEINNYRIVLKVE